MKKQFFIWVTARRKSVVDQKLKPYREAALADVAGREVLEVGAGSGANVPYYRTVKSAVLLEPNAEKRVDIQEMIARLHASNIRAVDGSAEELPFPDNSFDTVVTTLVLCSVQDVPQALAEIRRVLRPGGRYVFFEHVAADSGWLRFVQKVARPLWLTMTGGCDCHREVLSALEAAQFARVEAHTDYQTPTFFLKPFLIGSAQK